jgi:hypothetical protein
MAIRLTSTANSAAENGLKLLVHGPSGSGKTTLCATTGEPTVIISAEAGLLSLRNHNIPVIEVKTIQDVHEAYQFVLESAEAKHFRYVCLDSISEIAEVVLNNEKKATRDPRAAYGALVEQMTDLIRAFRDLPARNVYFSCKQERVKDEATGAVMYGPGMPGQRLATSLPYFFDFVMALRVEKDPEGKTTRWLQTGRDFTHEAKDRSGALDMFELPDLAAIAKKIKGDLPKTEAAAATADVS